MKKSERMIQFFDLILDGITKSSAIKNPISPPRNIEELMGDIEKIREANKARVIKKHQGVLQELRLEDMETREDCWVLLINVVDPSEAHPVTQVLAGNDDDRQGIELSDKRGMERSSHVVIYKQSDGNKSHLALFEQNRYLSFSRAISFVNNLAREAAKMYKEDYSRPHPSGEQGKTIWSCCRFRYLGHPSDSFVEELENGVLSNVRLMAGMEQVAGFDAKKQPELKGTEILVDTNKKIVLQSGGNQGLLKKVLGYAQELHISQAKVVFTDAEGTGHTALVDAETGKLFKEEKYVKKKKIAGFGDLRTSFPVIHDGIRDKMLALNE